jgi:hypothetical protein
VSFSVKILLRWINNYFIFCVSHNILFMLLW